MIDNFAIFIFGALVVYTAFRAVKLDKLIPWFTADTKLPQPKPKKAFRR
jgi:uncharacterized paraquat-inducible protein A